MRNLCKWTALALAFLLCHTVITVNLIALADTTVALVGEDGLSTIIVGEGESAPACSLSINQEPYHPPAAGDETAREEFINSIITLAKTKYNETGGKARRAQYSGDIYVCKNFTVYLFRENRDRFRIAEFPDVTLVIPDNQKREDCAPYVYGVEWKDIPASQGNPFYVAASFRYDKALTMEENRENARSFLQQVRRGDFFQMAADYFYGTGAHSMIYTADYDSETDSVYWTDSNMKGEKRGGERYGYVQFDAVKDIDWFVDAFCRRGYGATLYRLRDDIIFAPVE